MSARTKILAHCFSNIYNWINGQQPIPSRPKGNVVFKPVTLPDLREVSEILDGSLYLSGSMPLTGSKLESLGITTIICALTEMEEKSVVSPTYSSSPIRKVYVRVLDSESSNLFSHFDSIGKIIDEEINRGGKVLVHCLAGVSRSPTLVMAYLIRFKNYTLMDAYDFVAEKRKIVEPNDGFYCQLARYEKELMKNPAIMTKCFENQHEQDSALSDVIMMVAMKNAISAN